MRVSRVLLLAPIKICNGLLFLCEMSVILMKGLAKLFGYFCGRILVILAFVLMVFSLWVYSCYAVPTSRFPMVIKLLQWTVGAVLFVHVSKAFYTTCSTDPGTPPLATEANMSDVERGDLQMCKKCGRLRPERCHHCSICRRCVLRMDHHCPWMNRCIGQDNHRYFYLTLLWVSIAGIYGTFVFFPLFVPLSGMDFLSVLTPRFLRIAPHVIESLSRPERQCILTVWAMAVGVSLSVTGLCGLHTYLIRTNQTSLELQIPSRRDRAWRRRNPHDKGKTRNWQEVMGAAPLPYCLLPYTLPSPSFPHGSFVRGIFAFVSASSSQSRRSENTEMRTYDAEVKSKNSNSHNNDNDNNNNNSNDYEKIYDYSRDDVTEGCASSSHHSHRLGPSDVTQDDISTSTSPSRTPSSSTYTPSHSEGILVNNNNELRSSSHLGKNTATLQSSQNPQYMSQYASTDRRNEGEVNSNALCVKNNVNFCYAEEGSGSSSHLTEESFF